MIITKIYNCIGWSNFHDDTILLTNYYTPSNDYEGSEVQINGAIIASACSEVDALRYAMQEARPEADDDEISEVIKWILKH